jgi:hypothetical protein
LLLCRSRDAEQRRLYTLNPPAAEPAPVAHARRGGAGCRTASLCPARYVAGPPRHDVAKSGGRALLTRVPLALHAVVTTRRPWLPPPPSSRQPNWRCLPI